MADKKISELTELTTPDGTEELVVNDSGVSKKITQTNLLSTALPLAGGTMTGTIAGFTSTGIDDNATSTAITITSDGRGLSQFTAKAWVNFNGTGTVAIRDSHNCSSITDHSTGNWTVVYTNAIGANNCVNGYCKASAYLCQIDQPTTANTANVRAIHNDGTVMDVDYVSIIVFGD